MNVSKLNSELLRVSSMLQKLDAAIAEAYFTEIGDYGQLIKLLRTDDAKSYRTIGKAFNFVIAQYNSLITRHVLMDELGNRAYSMSYLKLSRLSLQMIETQIQDKLKQLEIRLTFVTNAAALMGISEESEQEPPITPPTDPEEPEVKPPVEPEEPNLKPFPTQVINRGWKRVKEFPEREWPGIQGPAIDNDWYYTFGMRSNSDTKLRLIVSNRRDNSKSFIATGDIGDYSKQAWKDNPIDHPLGHTNGSTVLEQNGDQVTLLVASMHPGQVATAIVNLTNKTVRVGKKFYCYGSKGEQIGAVTSVQKLADGRILFKASGYYWWGVFKNNNLILTKAFKYHNNNARDLINQIFGDEFVKSVAGQADWFEDGYLYWIAWSDNWEKCFVFELIPNGPNDTAIWSNRMWWDEVKNRRFEPERVWFENGKMMSGISMNRPYESFIAELNFEKHKENEG